MNIGDGERKPNIYVVNKKYFIQEKIELLLV